MSLRQGDKLHWAVLTLTWGIISDIDIESERYRWMGPTRFTAAAIPRLLSLRRYPGRLSYLPAMRPHAPHSEQADFPLANADGSIRFCYTDAKTAADSDGWAKVDGPFVHLMAMKSEWQSLDFKGGPFTAPNDGFIDLEWIAGGPREVCVRLSLFYCDFVLPSVCMELLLIWCIGDVQDCFDSCWLCLWQVVS
eukprot:m.876190 g.876190  ORF g.876190 m.876190 type:complete len:193 (-) comp23579_c0_seq13:580-1158(-)